MVPYKPITTFLVHKTCEFIRINKIFSDERCFLKKAFLKTNIKSHKCVLRLLQPQATRISHFKVDVFELGKNCFIAIIK